MKYSVLPLLPLLLAGCSFASTPLDYDDANVSSDEIASLWRDGGGGDASAAAGSAAIAAGRGGRTNEGGRGGTSASPEPDAGPGDAPDATPDAADGDAAADADAGQDAATDAATPPPDAAADAGSSDAGHDSGPPPLFTDTRICTPCSVENRVCGPQSFCLLPQGRCIPIRPAELKCEEICGGLLRDVYVNADRVGCGGALADCERVRTEAACF